MVHQWMRRGALAAALMLVSSVLLTVIPAQAAHHTSTGDAAQAAQLALLTGEAGSPVDLARQLDPTMSNSGLTGEEITPDATGRVRFDFNGDKKSDVLWRSIYGADAVWLMSGASIGAAVSLPSVSTAWQIVGVDDLNGDKKSDVIWRSNAGANAIWLMSGSTIIGSAYLPSVSTAWAIQGTGDFNADGWADILWRSSSGSNAIWFMRGASIIASASLPAVNTSWYMMGTADFNGDNRADVLWRGTYGGLAVWFMSGSKITSSKALPSVSTAWTIRGAGDYNGDGRSDILWRSTTGSNAIWYMNGSTITSSGYLPGVSTTWYITHDGDFNGDGRTDIAWRSIYGGNAQWYMTSSNVYGYSLPTVNTTWSVLGNWAAGTSALSAVDESASLGGNPQAIDGSIVKMEISDSSAMPELMNTGEVLEQLPPSAELPEGLNPTISPESPLGATTIYLPLIMTR